MRVFTDNERAYLAGQRVGRLATVDLSGQPHVVPVAYRFNPRLDAVEVGGRDFGTSKKLRDIRATGRVAFVVDDVGPTGRPRFIEIRGRAEVLETGGESLRAGTDPQMIRLLPRRILAWGIDSEVFGADFRTVG